MSKIDVVRAAMVEAMKAKDKERKDSLSMLLSALKNAQIDKREAPLTEDEENAIVKKEIKQVKETIETAPADRADIINEAKKRLAVYQEFAPADMTEDQIRETIQKVLAELGIEAPTAKDKGKTTITATIAGTDIKAECVVTVKNYVTMWVKTTGYCNCSSCAGQWAGAATASGTRPRENHTIAVDKRIIPLGTKVRIGDETYVAEDTGGAIKGNKIDVYYASHGKAMAHGVKYQKIRVYI